MFENMVDFAVIELLIYVAITITISGAAIYHYLDLKEAEVAT